jgi:Carboxypeptidase regulatory-like domain
MTSYQEAKLNMYDAVIAHGEANPALIALTPALSNALLTFTATVGTLHSTAQLEASAISGIAMDKADLKISVTDTALSIAGAVFAYAAAANNNELKEKVNFSRTALLRQKDELFTADVQEIHNQATVNLASLATYGITAPLLADFQTSIVSYAGKVPAPRNAASTRASLGEQIKTIISDCDEILKLQMDKLVLQLKSEQPVFYNAYKSNRVILDPGSSTTKLTGTVTDQGTDIGIANVLVQVVDQPYSTTTEADGEYLLPIPVPGTYSVLYSKAESPLSTQNKRCYHIRFHYHTRCRACRILMNKKSRLVRRLSYFMLY